MKLSSSKKSEVIQMRRSHIFYVATEVFSNYGFAGTNVDKIANRAGLGKGNCKLKV